MFRDLFVCLAVAVGIFGAHNTSRAADAKADAEQTKAALQELTEFIGQWNGNGEGAVEGKKALWKETWSWSWK